MFGWALGVYLVVTAIGCLFVSMFDDPKPGEVREAMGCVIIWPLFLAKGIAHLVLSVAKAFPLAIGDGLKVLVGKD
jgi:hypothetical protein